MPFLEALYETVGGLLPFEVMQIGFMRRALVALALLTPMTAAAGVHVVNHRMAFFSDAVSHSVFTGLALGVLLGLHPYLTVALFAVAIGAGMVALQRRTGLSNDTVIGVFFAAAVAVGLAMVSREPDLSRRLAQFIYGDILTISDGDVLIIAALLPAVMGFMALSFNRMLTIGISADLAQAHRTRVAFHQHAFSALLALLVVLSVRAVGVLLVTALLIVPAAAARNFSRSARAMFWWSQIIALTSAAAGLLLSAHDRVRTATGATIVLVACLWFALGAVAGRRIRKTSRLR